MSRRKNVMILTLGVILVATPIAIFMPSEAEPVLESNEIIVEETRTQPILNIDPATVDAKDLYTFMCEMTVKKPNVLYQTCADGGMQIYDITWSTWTPYGAKGRGTYSVNQCEPDCADGTRLETIVDVALDTLIQYKGKYYLSNLEVTPVNPRKVPAELNPQGGDVSEFAIMMDW
jgi:hypothetical protein